MDEAVNARLTRARYRWENRRKEAAEHLGRGTNEIFEWKVFPDAAQVRLWGPPCHPSPLHSWDQHCALSWPSPGQGTRLNWRWQTLRLAGL